VCYEFTMGVGTSRDGAEDSMPQVDRTDVFRKLEKVLATVQIKPLEKQQEGDVHSADQDSPKTPAIAEPAATVIGSDKL